MIEALDIQVKGIVQGVGFRPFVYRMAKKYLINGWVLNATDGVFIHAEGEGKLLDEFVWELSENPPAASHVEEISLKEVPLEDFASFEIRFSDAGAVEKTTLVSPDLATCDDCVRELFDPADRRYRYPFINCTNCGPRFTIIERLPYDRKNTSMKEFPMCPTCAAEYADPLDRRFHAQPDACFECGPHISWRERAGLGEELGLGRFEPARDAGGVSDEGGLSWGNTREESDAIFARAAAVLLAGGIVAVKGLGGFHLVCDANNPRAVATLRARKRREGKAFAVMMRDVDAVRRVCEVSEVEEATLASVQRPIVLLRKRPDACLAPGLADKLPELGVMLPYTPVQHLLLHDFAEASSVGDLPPMLVMTSGNLHDEPIVTDDEEALAKLADVADAFLGNDRAIRARYDDSVVRVVRAGSAGEAIQVVRRARGFAPTPTPLGAASPQNTQTDVSRETSSAENRAVGAGAALSSGAAAGPGAAAAAHAGVDAGEDASAGAAAAAHVGVGEGAAASTGAAAGADAAVGVGVGANAHAGAAAGEDAGAGPAGRFVFAAGPEQKNTFTMTREGEAFVSQHVGDMENAETYDAWLAAKARYETLFELRPTLLACDRHPEYLSTKWAREAACTQGLPLVEVQHHHAHIASVLGEHQLQGPVCGIAFDGTGYGMDGAIWGGEVLLANQQAFERFANFTYVPMPGGAAAVKHPLRMAYGVLWAFDLLEHPGAADVLAALGPQADLCEQMIERGINTPHTSSVGRLFDAASALLGICTEPLYEGEPAILLEAVMSASSTRRTSEFGDVAAAGGSPSSCELGGSGSEAEPVPETPRTAGVEGASADSSSAGGAGEGTNVSRETFSSEAGAASASAVLAYAGAGAGGGGAASCGAASCGVAYDAAEARYAIDIVKNTARPDSTAQDTSVVLLDAEPLFRALLDDKAAGVPVAVVARRFHDAFVRTVVAVAELVRAVYGIDVVALSGGVFMNRYLIENVLVALEEAGFTVAINRDLPPNDGCVSFGQAVVACALADE